MWDQLRAGDKNAFDYIFDKYISLLQWYGEKITSSQGLVEDSIQELFIELWNKKRLLSATTSVKFYLFKSLRRRIIRKLQKENWHRRVLLLTGASAFDLSRESAMIEEESDAERRTYIKTLINALSSRQQEIIYLRFYEDLSPAQISEVMRLSVPSVYSLMGKAFAALRKERRIIRHS